jgi:hypothetical protein
VLEASEARPLEEVLVDLDGAGHLALFPEEVAQDHVDLERVRRQRGGLAHLVDGQIELVGDQEVQALHVVRRLAVAPPVDPPALAQLVAFPRLTDGEADQEGDQRRQERGHRSAFAPVPGASARLASASIP